MKYFTLRNIRRIYSIFFFLLFVLLLLLADFRNLKGYEVALFLELSPLISISTFLTSHTVYKGLLLSLLVIIPTLFLGRFFCSWICPMGILNQWVSLFLNGRKAREDYEVNAYRSIYRFKYYLVTLLLIPAFFGSLLVGLFDPVALLTRSFAISIFPAFNYNFDLLYLKKPLFYGGIVITFIFLTILFANRFVTRFWCRVLCPLGALLGIFSIKAIFRIRRNVGKCTDCKKCLRFCHGGCDPHQEIRFTECHLCMNCIEDCPEGAIYYGIAKDYASIQAPLDINRRRLIETAVAGVVLFPMMRSSLNADSSNQPAVIRPPGSIGEGDFLRRCIKCGECMRVCPTNVIQPALSEAGFEGVWTPVLINKIGYCEYNCILCGYVCPTGAIKPLSMEEKIGKAGKVKQVKTGTAFYDRGRCLPWAMSRECIVCEEVCPTSPKAIWFQTVTVKLRTGKTKKLKRPFVDTKRCVGCGICENKCPVRDLPAIRVTSTGETRSGKNRMTLL